MEQILLTPTQAVSARLAVSRSQVYKWLREGRLRGCISMVRAGSGPRIWRRSPRLCQPLARDCRRRGKAASAALSTTMCAKPSWASQDAPADTYQPCVCAICDPCRHRTPLSWLDRFDGLCNPCYVGEHFGGDTALLGQTCPRDVAPSRRGPAICPSPTAPRGPQRPDHGAGGPASRCLGPIRVPTVRWAAVRRGPRGRGPRPAVESTTRMAGARSTAGRAGCGSPFMGGSGQPPGCPSALDLVAEAVAIFGDDVDHIRAVRRAVGGPAADPTG